MNAKFTDSAEGYRRFSSTMHCQKLGQDLVTSATTQYQLLFLA